MLLWARDLTDTGLIINLVLSCYLIIGARIEEARLRVKWAVQYSQYCKAVPRFIPRRIPRRRELLA
jgi:protein-S-isoprenylcysteine O-methyltransferase Ste14